MAAAFGVELALLLVAGPLSAAERGDAFLDPSEYDIVVALHDEAGEVAEQSASGPGSQQS